MVKFAVITDVPAPEDSGNLALPFCVLIEDEAPDESNGYKGVYRKIGELIGIEGYLRLRTQVFTLGEVLLVNDDGREIVGHGRKPNKWSVGFETFDDASKAVERSLEVSLVT